MIRLLFLSLFAVTFYACSESVDSVQVVERDLFQESDEFKRLAELRDQRKTVRDSALKTFSTEGRAKTKEFTRLEKDIFRDELQELRLAMISNSELPFEEQRTLAELETEILSERSFAYRKVLREVMGRDRNSSLALKEAYVSFCRKYPEVPSDKLASHLEAYQNKSK